MKDAGSAVKDIDEWLASIGLSEYAKRFADNAIDVSVLHEVTEQDLKELGVLPLGTVAKFCARSRSSVTAALNAPRQHPNRRRTKRPSAVTSRL
jgi:hypothetical protein